MLMLPRIDFMNVTLHPLTMRETLAHLRDEMHAGRAVTAVSLNVAKLVNLRHDSALRADLAAADLVLPDGMGIVWGARLLGLAVPERVAGIDLMDRMLETCAAEGWRPYFLGARPEVLERAVSAVRKRHPSLNFAGWQHGYFADVETASVVTAIQASGATCLFVGMPTPRKEQFLARHAAHLDMPFLMGVGGSLDILAGETKRAPLVWQNAGLEWLYRTIQEPRRMWRRYLTTNMKFAVLLAWFFVRRRVQQFRTTRHRPITRVTNHHRRGESSGAVGQLTVRSVPDGATPAVRCRTIVESDLAAVETLLREGFPGRPNEWFAKALAALARHKPPPDFPQFGYALECDGQLVGALLVIASACSTTGRVQVRRNASCWYVKQGFRVYASMLVDRGVRRCAATDVNISPASHTWPILEAQGFKRFNHGMFVYIPMATPRSKHARALTWNAAKAAGWVISVAQAAVLEEHESFGCLGLVCRDADGTAVCVFRERRFRRMPLAGAQVIYCDQLDDLRRFASVIGAQLVRHGYAWLALATNGPVAGLPGVWFSGRAPMYYRGADKPASGDLLYTEAALFGF